MAQAEGLQDFARTPRMGYIGIMEKKMETTIVHRDYIGIMEKKMEITIAEASTFWKVRCTQLFGSIAPRPEGPKEEAAGGSKILPPVRAYVW